jgi:hypothetical protein
MPYLFLSAAQKVKANAKKNSKVSPILTAAVL